MHRVPVVVTGGPGQGPAEAVAQEEHSPGQDHDVVAVHEEVDDGRAVADAPEQGTNVLPYRDATSLEVPLDRRRVQLVSYKSERSHTVYSLADGDFQEVAGDPACDQADGVRDQEGSCSKELIRTMGLPQHDR